MAVAEARGPHPLGLFLGLAMRRCADDPAWLKRILAGVRCYQQASVLPPRPQREAVLGIGGVALRDHGGEPGGRLVVVVPSLINAPHVLDLAPGRSLVEHLVRQGFRVLMVDWGNTGKGERRLGLAGLVSARLVPLVRKLGEPVSLVGYCLGGTLALAAACRLGPAAGRLALIAAPWHFDGFPAPARTNAQDVWDATRPIARQLGALPVSLLNPLFWSLDEDAVLRKFAALADREPDDPAIGWFAAVEDWANSGAPLSLPAARDLFELGFRSDRIGRSHWVVGGLPVRPEALSCPILDIGATRDRIVPKSARLRRAGVIRADVEAGHVGMVVGNTARTGLWEPLSNWLQTA